MPNAWLPLLLLVAEATPLVLLVSAVCLTDALSTSFRFTPAVVSLMLAIGFVLYH
ncbi:hypothetical protein D3C80_2214400 [compost metagenome]